MGPYEVVTAFDNGSIKIKTINGSEVSFIVNGHRLRLYHQPISKMDFVQNVLQQKEMEFVAPGNSTFPINLHGNSTLFFNLPESLT